MSHLSTLVQPASLTSVHTLELCLLLKLIQLHAKKSSHSVTAEGKCLPATAGKLRFFFFGGGGAGGSKDAFDSFNSQSVS